MKKILALVIVLVLCASVGFAASAEETGLNVLLLVPGTESSYFAAGVAGVTALEENFPGTTTEVIAMGEIPMDMAGAEYELEKYSPFFTEACESGAYDLIVCMGAECNPALLAAAEAYPDQLFFSADLQEMPETTYDNLCGLTYKTRDVGYMAGYVACLVTASDMPAANEEKKVGVIVGIDVPGLNEYIGSFCQVCKENGVTVYIDYAGDFIPDIAPEVAEKAAAMYADGVDVIWQVAGGAGSGVFTAAKEAGKYAFGVDTDQTLTVADPEEAATIVTSFYADYETAIGCVFADVAAGEFEGGYREVGLSDGFISYANNDQFNSMATAEIVEGIERLYTEMALNNPEIFSVIADSEGWETLKAEVTPQA